VARTPAGRRDDHGLGDQQIVVDQVGEGLEQTTDAGLVDRRGGDHGVGGGKPLDRSFDLIIRKAGDDRTGDVHRDRSEIDHGDRRVLPGRAQQVDGPLRGPVREQPAGGGVADARVQHDQAQRLRHKINFR
jgi:hypothetical protein